MAMLGRGSTTHPPTQPPPLLTQTPESNRRMEFRAGGLGVKLNLKAPLILALNDKQIIITLNEENAVVIRTPHQPAGFISTFKAEGTGCRIEFPSWNETTTLQFTHDVSEFTHDLSAGPLGATLADTKATFSQVDGAFMMEFSMPIATFSDPKHPLVDAGEYHIELYPNSSKVPEFPEAQVH